jgi:hypothetical protein
METELGLVKDGSVSADILDRFGVLTLYKRNKVKRDLGWPRKEKLVSKNFFFFAIGRNYEKREEDICGLSERVTEEMTCIKERDVRRKRN